MFSIARLRAGQGRTVAVRFPGYSRRNVMSDYARVARGRIHELPAIARPRRDMQKNTAPWQTSLRPGKFAVANRAVHTPGRYPAGSGCNSIGDAEPVTVTMRFAISRIVTS